MVEEQLIYGIIGVVAAYYALRWYLANKAKKTSDTRVQHELAEVLNSDEHKVKGRFE